MKIKIILSLFVTLVCCLSAPQTAFGQTEKLGIVNYTPPKGWVKKAKAENIVIFSRLDETSGGFCVITLYGATRSTGKPKSDFTKEWNNLVVKPFQAKENPKTEVESANGWTITAGAASVDFQGVESMAFLSVMSGYGKTVSVLGISNDESYMPQLVAFNSGLELDKAVADNPIIKREEPLPKVPLNKIAAMHTSELVKEFENNEIRAYRVWVGKRVRVTGTINIIEVGKDGRLVVTFKSSMSTYGNARCYFNKSQSSRVAALNAHEEATVEGIVRGWEDGFNNAKVFVLLEDCVVP